MPIPLLSFCFSFLNRCIGTLDFHVEEVDLLEKVLDLFVLDVDVGIEADALGWVLGEVFFGWCRLGRVLVTLVGEGLCFAVTH